MAAEKPANNIATKTVSIKGETYFGGQRSVAFEDYRYLK
jgi:hypothetical protein